MISTKRFSYKLIDEGDKRNILIALFSIAVMLAISYEVKANEVKTKMIKPTIACSISIQSPQPLSNEIMLTFSLTNPLDEDVSLLTWYTPLEGFLSNLFIIKNINTHEKINYQGPMVKRGQPTENDYLVLAAKKKHNNRS